MSLGMIEFFFFLSLSKQALGRLPARTLFSLHFTSFSPWVLLPHSEPFVSHQCWSLLSRASFPFARECFAPSLGRGHSTARVKLQSVIHPGGLRAMHIIKIEVRNKSEEQGVCSNSFFF